MNTENIIAHARARFEHGSAKRVLKEKYQAKMVFAYRGGMFSAGPELINVLNCCPDHDSVILDLYENPIRVDSDELMQLAKRRWQEQMNAWLIEFEQQTKNR